MESDLSITDIARASARRVNRLRPLFQWEAMTADEMKTLIQGQVKSSVMELGG
jgi:hypothetical protein